MIRNEPFSNLRSPQTAVLLIFFGPSAGTNHSQRVLLTAFADSLQKQLDGLLKILRIDEATYPDVVQSFAITQTPAFVLVRRGIELWRQEGLSDQATLVGLIEGLLTQKMD